MTYFNVNIYSEDQALCDFRFGLKYIDRFSSMLHLQTANTKRNWYKSMPLTACCIFLNRLSAACTWFALEFKFGIHSLALSEVFWETVGQIIAFHDDLDNYYFRRRRRRACWRRSDLCTHNIWCVTVRYCTSARDFLIVWISTYVVLEVAGPTSVQSTSVINAWTASYTIQ